MLQTIKARRQHESLLTNKDTIATTIISLVLDEYGTEALEWDPHTLESQMRDDFRVDMHPLLVDKMNTAVAGIVTNAYYKDWMAFMHAANVLNDATLNTDEIDFVTPEEAAWAITEMSFWEDAEDTPVFSPEVKKFLGTICEDANLILPPPILSMADLDEAEARATKTMLNDPDMYQGWWKSQKDFAADVQDYVNERLQRLLTELSEAPIEGRDDASWKRFTSKVSSKITPRKNDQRPKSTF